MEECGFKHSPNDPCLFYTDNVICIVYVDDCLFFSPTEQGIQDIFVKMVDSGLDFNEESDVAGFLGVLLSIREDQSIELTQTGLIDRIILAMGLDEANPAVMTPAEYGGLPKDLQGVEAQESWSYRSVLGMMLYLCNIHPDIQFVVSQCARFTAAPKQSREVPKGNSRTRSDPQPG